jgi:hypothetical protein
MTHFRSKVKMTFQGIWGIIRIAWFSEWSKDPATISIEAFTMTEIREAFAERDQDDLGTLMRMMGEHLRDAQPRKRVRKD